MIETIPAALHGERVDRVVALLTGLPRAKVAELVADGAVRLGGRTATTRSQRVATGDVVEVAVPERVAGPAGLRPDPAVEVPVVHADDHVVVVDKPAGLVVHPGSGHETGTLAQGLLARFPEMAAVGDPARPGLVHRLDKGTSGLLAVARSALAYDCLVAQLQARTVERAYLALVLGHLSADAGLVDAPVGRNDSDPTRMAVSAAGKEARTRYEVRRRYERPEPTTLLDCRLETGRTHQVRVHLAAIGHPLTGDPLYGGGGAALALERPFLHARELAFDHPATGERLRFASPTPADLAEVLARLS